jgi:hypothetical protein
MRRYNKLATDPADEKPGYEPLSDLPWVATPRAPDCHEPNTNSRAEILPTYRIATPTVLHDDQFSGASRIRTGGLRVANATLYQLSYGPVVPKW